MLPPKVTHTHAGAQAHVPGCEDEKALTRLSELPRRVMLTVEMRSRPQIYEVHTDARPDTHTHTETSSGGISASQSAQRTEQS